MTYEYECLRCGKMVLKTYSITADKPAMLECECGGLMRRIYTAPAIKFKGDGFYTNDQWHNPNENPEDLE